MVRHAIAMVRWSVFRRGELAGRRVWRGRPTIFEYASKQKRLIDLVGKGGTLWLTTSRKID